MTVFKTGAGGRAFIPCVFQEKGFLNLYMKPTYPEMYSKIPAVVFCVKGDNVMLGVVRAFSFRLHPNIKPQICGKLYSRSVYCQGE